MGKLIIAALITFGFVIQLYSQETKETRIPMLGEVAPSFTAESTKGNISFPGDYFQKWKIIFSHPADFTPVCSTEILELAALQNDFDRLNTKIMVVSTDGINSHIEWIKSLESIKYKGRDPVKINFPLISDANLEISKKYGMIHFYNSTTKDVRGVFIIDPDNRIQAIFFYPSIAGRNIDEIKRTLIAVQTANDKNVLIPANWLPGHDVLLPAPRTVDDAEKLMKKNDPDLTSLTWYLWFKAIK